MGLRVKLQGAKAAIVQAAGPLGLYSAAWQLTCKRPRIFMYHRFAAYDSRGRLGRDTFLRQIRFIRTRCRIVTMAELAEILRTEPDRAAGLAVITVDDGYRDFHDFAWPVLKDEGVPATFFPVTGFVDGETWLWPDLVEQALVHTSLRRVSSSDLGLPGPGVDWMLDGDGGNRSAWEAVIDYAIDLPDAAKWMFIQALHERLGLRPPTVVPDEYAPVSWSQLRAVAASGIEIGAHTRSHCRLTRVDDEQIKDELGGARERLERQLDRPVVSLCYPNGMPEDYDARVMAAVEIAGYRSAVTAYFDGTRGGLYDLRRHGAGVSMYEFHKSLHGVNQLARILTGRT